MVKSSWPVRPGGSVNRTSVRYAEDPGSSPGPVKLFALFVVHKNSKINMIYIGIYVDTHTYIDEHRK